MSSARLLATRAKGIAPEPAILKKKVDAYYTERVEETWDGGHIMVGREPGADAIRLVSNDYLCMARHPEIIAAQRAALDVAEAPVMAAVFLHGENPQGRFEASMAEWMLSESAVISQSGWTANTGLIQAVADVETPC